MDFNSSGGIRSPFSPRVRQSITGRRPIGLASAKKTQSKFLQSAESQSGDVIYKTQLSTVETYGMPLPVMVTETLTFASGDVSVRLSSCGWCWLVAGRRILAWPREALAPSGAASPAPTAPAAARELTLPQTDLAHKADLVVLFYDDNTQQMPSCIGVSPEGTVRYWPSIGQEGVYVDTSAELAGQECERLGDYTRAGLVLATTTCTVVLLHPTVVDSRATVTCRTLRPPSGWLGGIGRRVSLLFFGSMPAHAETKLVGVVVLSDGPFTDTGTAEGDCGCIALVAGGGGGGGPLLQLWRGAELHEHSLRRALADAYQRTQMQPQGDLNSVEIMALDVKASGCYGILLLIAAVNITRSPEMKYAIAHISVEDLSSPVVTSLVPLRSWSRDEVDDPPRFLPLGHRALLYSQRYLALVSTHISVEDLSSPIVTSLVPLRSWSRDEVDDPPRFLPLGHRALLYSQRYLALVSSTVPNEKVDFIDVASEGDRILGAELCNGVPLLFSKKHGVLVLTTAESLAPTPSMCDSPMGSPCPSDMYDGNLSLYEIDPNEVSMVTTDACGKVKTAFLFHLRRDTGSCRALLDELFPPPPAAPSTPSTPSMAHTESKDIEERDVDAVLDRTVLKIATEMLDDIPAGDPRWKHRASGPYTNIALGSSAALQIAAQLRDKQRAFSLFVDFLRATGLWQRLGLVSRESGGGVILTTCVLRCLAEQLAAAMALRKAHQENYTQLIDAAIYQVVCGENPELEEDPEVEAALSSGALSPSDVCYRRVSRITRVLRALARLHHTDARAAARHATDTINVITTVLTEMHKVRSQWQSHAVPPQLGPKALLPALIELHKRAITECGRNCPDPSLRSQVYEAAATLTDLILTEAEHLNAVAHTQHIYHKMRRDAILPFIEEGQKERAAVLAEKFKDFELLIEMCVKNNDLDKLYHYIDKYVNEGIAEVAFAWLTERGGPTRSQLVRSLGARYPARLASWLSRAEQRQPLLALHHLANREYQHAANRLANMAEEETESVQRMTTMASLAKLCLLASEEHDSQPSDAWRKIESRLSLGEQHAALPRDLKIHHGLDAEDTRVMTPEELVQMYIESESKSLTEYDYKKTLDLTDFIQDMERRDDLRLRIWCACIRRDNWSSCAVDSPHDELSAKMFFRLVDLVHLMGGDLEILLPPVEDIMTAPELADLVSDPRFHFIIKYGYECVDTTRNEVPMEA